MAIVPDLSGNSPAIDPPLTTPNITGTGAPTGVVTPNFSGEIYQDTDSGSLWYAMGTTNITWAPYTLTAH